MRKRPAQSIQCLAMRSSRLTWPTLGLAHAGELAEDPTGLTIRWADNLLTIKGPGLPEEGVSINYLEAYCRPGSTDRDWAETVIPHTPRVIEAPEDGKRLRLRDTLADGLVVDHLIEASQDAVSFQIVAHNPTDKTSDAHWAQPCIRVARFTGVPEEHDAETYLPKCFVMIDKAPRFLPTEPWATKARYVPGQVYGLAGVDRQDLNPRPLSELAASDGLMGCVSGDGQNILAVAFEPSQELFQGVIVCIHADFRLGGLNPGETKRVRGRLYVVPNDLESLVGRYQRDFAR